MYLWAEIKKYEDTLERISLDVKNKNINNRSDVFVIKL